MRLTSELESFVCRRLAALDTAWVNDVGRIPKDKKGAEKLNKEQQAVHAFMVASNQETNLQSGPFCPSYETRALRGRLLTEEVRELLIAQDNLDFVEVADALADIAYVLLGTANAWGINLGPIFDEVHRSNMTKIVDGECVKDERGKVLKPPSYEPPNLAPLIEKQKKLPL